MSPVSTSPNKSTFLRFHDAINTGDVTFISRTIDEVFEPDVVLSTPLPVDAVGADGLKGAMAILLQAFPDLRVSVEDMIEEDDIVVGRNVLTGTHQGEYMGVPPTGMTVEYAEIFLFRFVDSRVAETWGVVDVFSQMQQLGLIAAPGRRSSQP
jgi:steroid delta-isomerase-like uncharacterized protein